MKTKNASARGVKIGRHYIPPGAVVAIPDDLLFKKRQQRLKADKVLEFPVKEEAAKEEEAPKKVVLEVSTDVANPEIEVEVEEGDELTELTHIGKAREKILSANGIDRFLQLVDLGAQGLKDMLDVDLVQAKEIVDAARDKLNG